MGSFPLVDLFLLGSAGWTAGGSLADGDWADDDLVWGCSGLEGGGGGSFSYDFPGASFLGWPSSRLRRLADGFLLKPMLISEEVPWRSASSKF